MPNPPVPSYGLVGVDERRKARISTLFLSHFSDKLHH